MTYTEYINLVEAITGHQKFLLKCRELPTVALSHHLKIRENDQRQLFSLLTGTNVL